MSKATVLNKRIQEEVNALVDTSVDDAQSSLHCNRYSQLVLSEALKIAKRRGEKTKVKIFAAALRRLEKRNKESA